MRRFALLMQPYQADKTAEGRAVSDRAAGTQRAVGHDGAEAVVQSGVSEDLSAAGAVGRDFGLSQSRVNRWLQRLLPIVQQALDGLGVLPGCVPEQFAEQDGTSGKPRHGSSTARTVAASAQKQGKTGLARQWQAENA